MAKLDWSKVSQYEPDPARVQRVIGFEQPDRPVKKPKKKSRRKKAKPIPSPERTMGKKVKPTSLAKRTVVLVEEPRRKVINRAELERDFAKGAARKAARQAAQRAAKLNATRKAEREQARQERLRQIEAAEAARKLTPEYIAAQQAEADRLAEIERQRHEQLQAERESLRQIWREKLLRKP